MPHKANPARATMIAGGARRVPALAGVLYASLVAEDERPAGAWHAEWPTLRDALRTVGGMAATAVELTAGLRVRPERMRANLGATRGQVMTERLVAALTPLTGRAEARAAVARAGERVARGTVDLPTALGEDLVLGRLLTTDRIRTLVDPSGYHGSAGALVDRALRRPDPDPGPDPVSEPDPDPGPDPVREPAPSPESEPAPEPDQGPEPDQAPDADAHAEADAPEHRRPAQGAP